MEKWRWIGTAQWINVLRKQPPMYLAGNYCYRINAETPPPGVWEAVREKTAHERFNNDFVLGRILGSKNYKITINN